MNYPTYFANIERSRALLTALFAEWQAHDRPNGKKRALGTPSTAAGLTTIQNNAREVLQNFAKTVFMLHPELASPNTGDDWPASKEELGLCLRTLVEIHDDAVQAAESLQDALSRGKKTGIEDKMTRCLGIQEALVMWHRRLLECTSALVIGHAEVETDAEDKLAVDAKMEAGRNPVFKKAHYAVREIVCLLQQDETTVESKDSSLALEKAIAAASAVGRLLDWAKAYCAKYSRPSPHQSLVARLLAYLPEESQKALDEILGSIQSIKRGDAELAKTHLDDATAFLMFAEVSFEGLEDPDACLEHLRSDAAEKEGRQ